MRKGGSKKGEVNRKEGRRKEEEQIGGSKGNEHQLQWLGALMVLNFNNSSNFLWSP